MGVGREKLWILILSYNELVQVVLTHCLINEVLKRHFWRLATETVLVIPPNWTII